MNIQFRHRCLSMVLVLVMLFTMTPVSVIAEEEHDHSHESTETSVVIGDEAVAVLATEELAVSASASANHVYVGDGAVTVTAKISGGMAPYEVQLQAVKNGDVVATDSVMTEAASAKLTFTPASYGDYELVVVVHDALHTQELVSISLAAAEHDEESEQEWAASVSGASVSSDWAKSLVSVAKTQVGYTESAKDFVIKNGAKEGYSRYGAWFGTPYSGWNTAFLAFVTEYANIPTDAFLSGSSYRSWVNGMSAKGAYEQAGSGYAPKAGDIAFLSGSRVAIIESVSGSNLTVIEGDVDGAVVRKTYALSKVAGIGNTQLLMGLYNGTATAVPAVTPEPTKAPEGSEPVATATPVPTAAPTATPVPEDDEELTFQATPTPGPGVTVAPKEDDDILGSMVNQMGDAVEQMQAAATSVPTQFSEAYYLVKDEMAKLAAKYLGEGEKTPAEIKAFVDGLELGDLYYIVMELDEMEEYAGNTGLTDYESIALFEKEAAGIIFINAIEERWGMLTTEKADPVTILDGQITISSTRSNDSRGDATLSVAEGNVVTATATGYSYWGSQRLTHTLTIANNSSKKIVLSFTHAVDNAYSLKINGVAPASNSNSVELASGGSFQIALQSNAGNSTATLTLSDFVIEIASGFADITLGYVGEGTVAFATEDLSDVVPATGIMLDDVAIGSGVTLTAMPATGSVFLGWIDENSKVLTNEATYVPELNAGDVLTIKAVFAKDGGTPWFGVGGATSARETYNILSSFTYYNVNVAYLYGNLNDAVVHAANESEKYVVLMNNGTLESGDYAIPSGVTLLIPFDDTNTMYTTHAQAVGSDVAPTAYRTLTMASGAKLEVNGAISVSAKLNYATSDSRGSAPTGKVGHIDMASNSSITVNSGGVLYVYGYIVGSGSVTAKSGSKVYECFQFMDFRGGSCTDAMTSGNNEAKGVFPLSQYYVVNIEVPLTLQAGATEYSYATMYLSNFLLASSIAFISSDDAMFNLTDGSVTKRFDGDRMIVTLDGVMTVAPISIDMSFNVLITTIGFDINSEKFELPIHGKLTLKVNSGSNLTLNQDIAMLPGSEIYIDEGATCILGKNNNIYFYDRDEWGNYCSSGSGSTGFTVNHGVYNPIEDAKIVVNGTVVADEGSVYTTAGGANICSDGTGVVTMKKGSQTITYQATQNDTTPVYHEIPITSAKLKNADGTYAKTEYADGTQTYTYTNGRWICTEHVRPNATEEFPDGLPSCADAICVVCGSEAKGDATQHATPYMMTVEKEDGTVEYVPVFCSPFDCSVCNKYVPAFEEHDPAADTICVGEENTCGRCGQLVTGTAEHQEDEGSVTTAPTCFTAGEMTYTCTVCNQVSRTVPIPATGNHVFIDIENDERNIPATCMNEGSKWQRCSTEGCTEENKVTLAALGHDYVAEFTQYPSCSVEGTGKVYCSRGDCDYELEVNTSTDFAQLEEQVRIALRNVGIDGVESLQKTAHTSNGILANCTDPETCKVCGGTITEALGHDYRFDITAPQCEVDGKATVTCSRCTIEAVVDYGDVIDETIYPGLEEKLDKALADEGYASLEKTGHKWAADGGDGWSVIIPATCTELGKEARNCLVDGCIGHEERDIPATGHTYTVTKNEQTNCLLAGSVTFTCACGHEKTTSSVDDADIIKYELVEWMQANQALTAHADLQTTEVEPSCTAAGTKQDYCAACDWKGQVVQTTDKTGHNYVFTVNEPECDVPGSIVFKCTNSANGVDCTVTGEVISTSNLNTMEMTYTGLNQALSENEETSTYVADLKLLAALEHVYEDEWTEDVPATCTTAGSEYRVCKNCGEGREERPTNQLGHSYDFSIVVDHKAPVCENVDPNGHGTNTYKCSRNGCDEKINLSYTDAVTYQESNPTLYAELLKLKVKEHAPGANPPEELVSEAKCGVDAVYGYRCANCDDFAYSWDEPGTALEHLPGAAATCTTAQTCTRDGCGEVLEAAKGHDLVAVMTVEPDCETPGEITVSCSRNCGVYEEIKLTKDSATDDKDVIEALTAKGWSNLTDTLKALGHEPGAAATCTTDQTCTRAGCGKVLVAATDHDYSGTLQTPTCTVDGYVTVTCSKGDYSMVYGILSDMPSNEKEAAAVTAALGNYANLAALAQTGHSYMEDGSDWQITLPECQVDGYKVRYCANNCGDKQEENITAPGHSYKAVLNDRTCTADGFVTVTCENCNDVNEVYGHETSMPSETKMAAAVNEALATGDYTELSQLVKKPHSYTGEWETVTSATCTEAGSAKRDCDYGCDISETKVLDKLNHSFVLVITAPKCEEDGYITVTCTRGDITAFQIGPNDEIDTVTYVGLDEAVSDKLTDEGYESQAKLAQKGHSYTEWTIDTEATCTTEGKTVSLCDNGCGTQDEETIPAKGHNYGEPYVKVPDCTKPGTLTYTCDVCDEGVENHTFTVEYGMKADELPKNLVLEQSVIENLKATGHQNVTKYDEEAKSCLGYWSYGEFCNDCQTWIVEREQLKADCEANTNDKSHYTAATCEKAGYYTYPCYWCNEYKFEVEDTSAPAINHANAAWDEGAPATCESIGYTPGFWCPDCKDYLEGHIEIEILAHEYEVTSSQDPDCENEGFTVYTCKNGCNDSYELRPSTYNAEDVPTELEVTLAMVDALKAQGHDWKDATCYEPKTCQRVDCGETEGEKREHDWSEWADVTGKEATCTENGYESRACKYTDCDATEEQLKSAFGHDYFQNDVYVEEFCIETVEATCTADGYKVYECETCKQQETVTLTKLGHDMVHNGGTPATCTKDGAAAFSECQRPGCDYTENAAVIPAKGHDYFQNDEYVEEFCIETVEATCTADGYKVYECKSCTDEPEHSKTVTLTQLGHDYSGAAATCTTAQICNRDDCTVELAPATNHVGTTTSHEAEAATCENVGYEAGEYCSACETWISGHIEIGKLVHEYEETSSQDPDCENEGHKVYTCKNGCEDSYELRPSTYNAEEVPAEITVTDKMIEDLKATGHAYKLALEVPTCTADGFITVACNNGCVLSLTLTPTSDIDEEKYAGLTEAVNAELAKCEYESLAKLTKLEHNFIEKVQTVAPVCKVDNTGEDGYTVYKCERCDETQNKDWVKWTHPQYNLTAATCTEDRKCTACGYVAQEKLGHDYEGENGAYVGEPDEHKDATCTEEGYDVYICDRCTEGTEGHSTGKVNVEPATEHAGTTEPHDKQDATCTEIGYEAGVYCTACKTWISGHEEIKATGHAYKLELKAPTCTADGYITVTCNNGCGVSLTLNPTSAIDEEKYAGLTEAVNAELVKGEYESLAELAERGHDWADATCTAPKTCKRGCGATEGEAAGHSYNVSDKVVATCKTEGVKLYTCSACGNTYEETIGTNPTKHTRVYAPKENPTCTDPGKEAGQICSECGITMNGRAEIPATGHSYTSKITTKPTCEEEGVETFTCSNDNCGDTYTKPVAATGHTEVDMEDVELTCEQDGSTGGKKCSVCGKVTEEPVITKTEGHKEEIDAAVAPTCTDPGLSAGSHCSVCDATIIEQKVVPANGHTRIVLEAVEPTCTKTGLTEGEGCKNCDVIFTAQEIRPATNHANTEKLVAVDPTCTGTGLKEGLKCKDCGELLIPQEVIPANGHDWAAATCTTAKTCKTCKVTEGTELGHNWQAATCTTAKTCKTCKVTEGTELGHDWAAATCTTAKTCKTCKVTEGEALGHTPVKDEAKAPTCTETGLTEGSHCSVCTAVLTAQTVISAKGHTVVVDAYIAPTCEDTGLTEGSHCSVCNETLTAQEVIPALQHKYVGTETKAPSCTEEGVMTYVCENDKTHTYNETIDALGHDAVQHEAQKVTCTEIGWEAYETCNRCDYTTYVEIPALGHKMDEGTVTKQFTCEEAGEVVYACLNEGCEYTETEVVEAHHVIVEIPAVAPTCTETGLTAGEKCDVCGTITKEQTVVAASHKWETVKVITEATCTTEGKEDVRCTVEDCGTTDTVVTPAKGHTEVIDEAVAETCTTDGLTEGKHCSVCNTPLVKQEVIPAAHKWNVAPCTYSTAQCTVCGKTNEALLEHAWSEPTCSEPATCQYCKRTRGSTLPHTEVIDEEVPALCEEPGLMAGKHCSVCGYVIFEQEVIPALGHKMVKYEEKKPSFTSDGWYEYEACTRCPYTEPGKEEYLRPALGEQSIDNYQEMLDYLPYLEQWAVDYARKTPGTDPVSLIIKYIRTGVERYNSGSWGIMAGYEDPGFAKYVAEEEDKINSQYDNVEDMIQVTGLKNLKEFPLPNDPNFKVDFGHMFGTMDITYTNKGSVNHADVGGWSGDLVDLLSTSDHDSHQDLIASAGDDFEALVTIIRTKLLGYDFDHEDTFALNDYYGDLDAFYIMENLNTENFAAGDMTKLFESYFTAALDDVARADFLLVNRFDDVRTRSAIREAVYNAYTTNSVISTLEGTREFVNTDDLITRRKAVCYAFADYLCILAGDWVDDTDNPYLTDYESSYSLLAPGISMEIHKATSQDGKNMVYYLGYADVGRADVDIMANYHDRYIDEGWKMSRVLDQANKAAEKYYANPESEHYIENFAPVVAVNGAGFDMGTGEPSGLLVMHGQEYHKIDGNGFFGITKDGKAVIGTTAEYNSKYKDELAEGIAGFGSMLVVNGELYDKIPTSNYYSDRASRTAVGITATGRVVFMVLDGRQEPWSCGGSMIEIAQIMKLAGCVTAVNLDGGGSTTFVARQAGDEELSLVNRPSDGVQRSVSTSLMMISTAPSSKTFDRALVEANYNFMTVGAEVNVSATGLSATNNIVALPEGAYWSVSDPEMAEIVDTGDVLIDPEDPDSEKKKTAKVIAKKLGDFEVYLMLDGVKIGQKTLNVIVPDQIYFTREKIDGIYGQGVELPIKARYAGKEAAFVPSDFTFTVSNPAVGTMDGLVFNAVEKSDIKTVTVTAALALNEEVTASINVVLYKDGENNFNFDNATGGNRELAWLREVSNAKQEGTSTYYIVDPNEDMVTTYTIALDMSQIPIPKQLEDLTYMLPGADMEGASAWTFLLQLAERISELTTVTAEFQIDPNFTLVGYDAETGVYDASGLTLINEYFVLNKETPIAYDPTKNTLTMMLNWNGKEISQAIDPATANPMCIVNGLKLVPKDDAAWDDKDRLTAVNSAEVGYKVYMRANALHTFASKPENQAVFGLYPYGPYTNSRGVLENGGWFQSIYATFKDTYTLIKSLKNGWVVEDGGFRYYVDGQYLTGVHLISDDGLYYQFNEKGINIGQTPYTGKHVIDGKTYYMQLGKPCKGWITLDDGNWYLFDWTTGQGIHGSHTEAFNHTVNGETVTNNVVYEFENGKLLDGVWYHDGIGWRYYYGPYYYKQGWRELTTRDGQTNGTGEKAMYFFEEYYAQQNISPVQEAHAIYEYWYEFTDEGALVRNAPTGLYWWDDDWYRGDKGTVEPERYYVDANHPEGNGYSLAVTDGLHKIDGDYYFFDLWTGKAHRNRTYYINEENTNGLLPKGTYRFLADGRIDMSTGVFNENGTLYYYLNGKRTESAGLVEYEGNIYGVGSGAICYVNQSAWIAAPNGLVTSAGTYRFDANGHLIVSKAVVDEGGTLYYYNDSGRRVANAGLVEYGGDIYYIGEYTVNGTKYNESTAIAAVNVEINVDKNKTNGLLPAGTYRFDENGQAILTTELVEGNDGKLYYYMNGALQKGAGMIKYADAYYYIDANGAAVTNTEMLIEKPIAPFPADTYEFGADGKMIIHEGIYEGYYYVGGIKTAAGLVEEDGKYYFAAEGGKIVTNTKYDVQKTNDLLPAGIYRVGEDGALNLKTELADENGTLVYYKNGKLAVNEGLLQIDGDYYYIGENGIALVNAKQKVTNTNGLQLTAGTYRFGADGKAILTTDLVKEADGKLYYYENGRMADHAKLIEVKGDYYWVEVNGFVLTNQKISLSAGEKLPAGIYRIGADGKVILTTELVNENGNLTYYKNGILTRDAGLINLNDAYYYINDSGYAVVSVKCDVIKHNNLKPAGIYRFDENGKMIQTTEVVLEGDGKYYYYENGKLGKDAGLVAYKNAYYYIAADGTAVTDEEVYVEKTNGLLPAGTYRFDEEGKADLATELVEGEDGKLYYYVNGALAEDAGLIEYEGAYYYITAEGSAVTDTKMLVEKTNNHFPVDTYEFGKDGKLVIREGIYEGYYYVGGVKTAAGLVKVGNDYYYAADGGKLVTGAKYDVVKTNDLKPAGIYRFDEDGKAIMTTELVAEDGKLYYYEDGKLAKDAGLIKVGNDYYYITAEGTAATDAKMLVEKTNDLFPVDTYEFGKDGKMVIREGVYEGYYYVGGVKTAAGLVKVGNDYYYAAEGGKLVTDTKYDVVKTNDLKPAGIYRFDEDGKAIMTTELVDEDGKLYYYEDGKLGKDAGLIKVGNDYYYIGEEGTAVTDTQMLVEKTNDLLPVGTYCFGTDGKMFERLAGDADENGIVDLEDAVLVFAYCADETVKINLINANVNGDAVVDMNDALLLMQYDAGWDVELK